MKKEEKDKSITILGAGLAGLTLALQLKKEMPDLKITIVEKTSGIALERAHKVGESFVEISSWYLAEILSLKQYLLSHHLPKFGLRFFFNHPEKRDFEKRPEYGIFEIKEIPKDFSNGFPDLHLCTYNIERGRLENDLVEKCIENGVNFHFNTKVKNIEKGENMHTVVLDNHIDSISTDWIIDTTGRRNFIARNKQQIQKTNHKVNGFWIRLSQKIDPDNFSESKSFKNRIASGLRWLSTNHLMGIGYWVWIIPLPDDATSIGIMADPKQYKFEELNSKKKLLQWLKLNEPVLCEQIDENLIIDFNAMKLQSYFINESFSTNNWAISGEAGFFTDAFYSPGGDFIAVSNSIITNIIKADTENDRIKKATLIKFGNQLMQGFLNHYRGIFHNLYSLLHNPAAMIQKVAWDTAIYFGYSVFLFRNNVFTDPWFHLRIGDENKKLEGLQIKMQSYLRNFPSSKHPRSIYFDQVKIDHIDKLYESCKHEFNNENDLINQLRLNIETLDKFSKEIKTLLA